MEPIISFRSIQKVRNKGQISVAQMLRLYRNRSKLTQTELAQKIDLHTDRMIRKWENGQSLPESVRLKKLIEFYLAHSIFTRGQEKEEAYQLWEIVKAEYDAENPSFSTYNIFDGNWFEGLTLTPPPAIIATPQLLPSGKLEIPDSSQDSNLPLPVLQDHFIGRELELDHLAVRLKTSRLLTLSGPPGVGKSSLAHRLILSQSANFLAGIYLLNLDTATGPESLLQTLKGVLQLEDSTSENFAELLKVVRDKELLLVLDPFDHLLPEGIPLISQLLKGCPRLKIVVTSRESLDIAGEAVFKLKPFEVLLTETEGRHNAEIEILSEGACLFVDRARAIQNDFEITPFTSSVIERICRELDGLPLAIELAASLIEVLTVEQIAARLSDPFPLLKRNRYGNTRAVERQQSLEKTFEWSFDRLTPLEQSVLRLLCEIPGTFGLDSAQRKFREGGFNESEAEVLEALDCLVKKSLVEVEWQGKNFTFSILKTIRLYSLRENKLSISRGLNGKE